MSRLRSIVSIVLPVYSAIIMLGIVHPAAGDLGPEGPAWRTSCLTPSRADTRTILIRFSAFTTEYQPRFRRSFIGVDGMRAEDIRTVAFGDLDGDGRSDLLVQRTNDDRLFRGEVAPSGELRLTALDGFDHMGDLSDAVIFESTPGLCARFFIPPKTVHLPYTELSRRTLEAVKSVRPAGTPLVRWFQHFRSAVVPSGTIYPAVVTQDLESAAAKFSLYSEPAGWVTSDTTPYGTLYIGLGTLPGEFEHRGFDIANQINGDVAVTASRESTDTLVVDSWKSGEEDPRVILGDFNGDSVTDILRILRGGTARSSKITFLLPRTPLTRNLPGLSEMLGTHTVLGVGDFDGNGLDELLVRDGATLYTLQLDVAAPPCADLRVVADGANVSRTSDGRTAITLPVGGRAHLRFASEECALSPAEFNFVGDAPGLRSLVVRARRRLSPPDLDSAPFPCTGFNPGYEIRHFERWGRIAGRCPRGYGVVEVDDNGGAASCCPLPYGALAESSTARDGGECAAGEIATGLLGEQGALECTAIVGASFALGEAERGVYWGNGTRSSIGSPHLARLDLPHELRSGIGRLGWKRWDIDGCIGGTPGAFLLGTRGSGNCGRYRFARLSVKNGLGPPTGVSHSAQQRGSGNPFDPVQGDGPQPFE